MLTNVQLVAWALAVYAAKWVYWYGTCGYNCTTSLYDRKKKQYPSHYTSARAAGYQKDIAAKKMCADCVGFIKAFFWMNGILTGTSHYKSNGCPDTSANGMFKLCKKTGCIATMPNVPGLVVWKDGHIGVHVGNGYVVELRGFAYDCQKRKVEEGPWTHWGYLPETILQYVDTAVIQPTYKLGDRDLEKGDEGTDVKEMQAAFKSLGYDLGSFEDAPDGIDGDFGKVTKSVVEDFQRANGLTASGIFDEKTYKALLIALEAKNPTAPGTESPGSPDDGGSEPVYELTIEGAMEFLTPIQTQYGGTISEVKA